ncbi:hypothetical protein PybrP1_007773 [[Pythium] brassicae (nom. inval.)]|nr:hypothetical protein PybrP1_007773 [[Pythium] brassicae (nom. inval.)]
MATLRRRRCSSASCWSRTSSLGVSAALAVACCSTLVLQALTTALEPRTALSSAPTAVVTATSGMLVSLLAQVGSTAAAAAAASFSSSPLGRHSRSSSTSSSVMDVRAIDLRVANVSVHRVRYVNRGQTRQAGDKRPSNGAADSASGSDSDSLGSWWNGSRAESFVGRWTRRVRALRERKQPVHVTSVVVTWDDHFRAASTLTSSAGDEDGANDAGEPEDIAASDALRPTRSGVEVTYEVQHWVTGWGLDALWHPSNRVVSVVDPFAVLSNLPQEHEVAFRVRMKVKQTAGLLSSSWFATETEGPWSAATLLSPSRDDALDAILAFLLSNKAFFVVLLVCIGSGSLVLGKLFVSHRWAAAQRNNSSSSSHALATMPPLDALDESTSDCNSDAPPRPLKRAGRSIGGDLVQEIRDLRQELADSEAEVRRLMVFRGYGVERLAAPELAIVERELRATLQQIRTLRKLHASPSVGSRHGGGGMSSEDDTEEDEGLEDLSATRDQMKRAASNAATMSTTSGTPLSPSLLNELHGTALLVDDHITLDVDSLVNAPDRVSRRNKSQPTPHPALTRGRMPFTAVSGHNACDASSRVDGLFYSPLSSRFWLEDTDTRYSSPDAFELKDAGTLNQCSLSWQNISFTVQATRHGRYKAGSGICSRRKSELFLGTDSVADTGRSILKNVSGRSGPGDLTAIIGPSGAGKTTLLDLLAGRLEVGSRTIVGGLVEVNGRPREPKTFRSVMNYVPQETAFLGSFTVLETLQMAAGLSLPAHVPQLTREMRVHDVVDDMGLRNCARTRHIAKLCSEGKNIVCTIHQPSSAIYEMLTNLVRNWMNNWRNPGVFWIRLLMYLLLSLMVGTMYMGSRHRLTNEAIVPLLFYVQAFLVFMSVAALPAFIEQRAVFQREVFNNSLHLLSYTAANLIAALPGILLISVISSAIVVYFAEVNSFGTFLLNLSLSLVVSESLMHVIGAAVPHYIIGIALGAGLFGMFMLCEGFMVPASSIPSHWRWGYYLAFHTYSFESFMYEHFSRVDTPEAWHVLKTYDMLHVNVMYDMLILVGYAVALQLLFILILYFFRGGRRQ